MLYIPPSAEKSPKPRHEEVPKVCDMWGRHYSFSDSKWSLFFLPGETEWHNLAAYTYFQLHLFLTSPSDIPNRIILGWKINSWQNLTWIPLPKLQAKQREICKQAAFCESAALTMWVIFPHRHNGRRPIRCVISRAMCTLSCAMRWKKQSSVTVHAHQASVLYLMLLHSEKVAVCGTFPGWIPGNKHPSKSSVLRFSFYIATFGIFQRYSPQENVWKL